MRGKVVGVPVKGGDEGGRGFVEAVRTLLLLNTMRGDGRGHIMKDSDSV